MTSGSARDATAEDGGTSEPGGELERAVHIFLHGPLAPSPDAGDEAALRARTTIEEALTRVDLPGGTTLFERDDPGDSLYIIVRGRLRVIVADDHGEPLVRELGPDQTVGELALLTGEPRKGTVIAVRDSVLFRLGREDFDRCARSHPAVTRTMLTTLADRLNRPPTRGRATAVPTVIAVVPAGHDAPIHEFATRLHRFLAGWTDASIVSARSIEDAIGPGAADAEASSPLASRVHDHLARLERSSRHVIHLAEDDASPWSMKCARGADLVLLVGRAGSPPGTNELERRLFDPDAPASRARLQLVLVEPEARTTPTGTAAWLRERAVELCHHVHLEWPSHFARLARFIVGEPVGLVLSGGAARAYAHVGVLRVLREASIPVDVVAATSAGALIGGQFAMGWNPERIEQAGRELFGGGRRKLLDFVPPFTSLIGSSRFNAALDEIFADVRFEDLWIQFMCTTTDLTSARSCTHRVGRLRPFIRASCSLPIMLPPVVHEGHLLADGGIMNNVPVDPLLAVTNVGTLIVVDVTNPFYRADEPYNYSDSVPLGRILNSRFNPFAEKLVAPGILDVLMRSLEIGSKSLEASQIAKADVYLRPDVGGFGYTDVAAIGDIVDAGGREARQRLAELDVPAIPFT